MIYVNGITYKKPEKPCVVVCMDGISPQYLEEAIEFGEALTFKKFKEEGFYKDSKDVIPSLTNPNNISIITGVLPNVHGIITCGLAFNRYKWDYEIISSPEYIRCDTLLRAFHNNGLKVASITTKDKLRYFLSTKGNNINISSEVAHKFEEQGIEEVIKNSIKETKDGKLLEGVDEGWMYSNKSSIFSLDLAIELLKGKEPYMPEIIYISLTDYIPHRNEAGTKNANSFIKEIDKRLGTLDDMGCVIGITSDHGMNNKHNPNGSPNAIWLKDILEKNKIAGYKIMLPVTDKYVAHHSCLGSCAWIYFERPNESIKAMDIFRDIRGVEEILFADEASEKYSLPKDLIGDIFLLSDQETVFGTTIKEHPNIPKGLRSHGGLHEQKVPFIINKSLNKEYASKNKQELKNFNIFEYVLNGI